MTKILSKEQISLYNNNGFVGPITIFSETEALNHREKFENYEKLNNGWYELSKGQKLHLLQNLIKYAKINPKMDPIKIFLVLLKLKKLEKKSLKLEKKVIKATAKITPGIA